MQLQIVYWTFRAIRIEDNPALFYALDQAKKHNAYLSIVFFIWPVFKSNNLRNMHFLMHGLLEMATKAKDLNIPLHIIQQTPHEYFKESILKNNVLSIVSEQHVLNEVLSEQDQVKAVCNQHNIAFDLLNTAMVVPVEEASNKLEYAARTIRKKIHEKLKDHLTLLPKLTPLDQTCNKTLTLDDVQNILNQPHWKQLSLSSLLPGEDAANRQLEKFIKEGLPNYHNRNEFMSNGQSYLSAYLHFGMISPKKVVSRVLQTNHDNAPLFIEEVLIRRELAENYCFYNKNYTNLSEGAWPWAIQTLLNHVIDEREYVYSLKQFENANTHDDLWNFCQKQIRDTGYLHSYLRMYWAKMVLYWTKHPQDAIDILVYLNDTYMLDGRDPSGYTGIMWSVAGVHDRPWFTKPITGLVRSMSKSGTLKKTRIEFMD